MGGYQDIYKLDLSADVRAWLAEQEAAGLSMAQAWEICPRADWMLAIAEPLRLLPFSQHLAVLFYLIHTPLDQVGGTVRDLVSQAEGQTIDFVKSVENQFYGDVINKHHEIIMPDNWTTVGVAKWTATWAAMWGCPSAEQTQAFDRVRMWQANKVREIVGNPFKQEGDE